jgi:hypothetical protein
MTIISTSGGTAARGLSSSPYFTPSQRRVTETELLRALLYLAMYYYS